MTRRNAKLLLRITIQVILVIIVVRLFWYICWSVNPLLKNISQKTDDEGSSNTQYKAARELYQWIPECKCSRLYIYKNENRKIVSSCSDRGTWDSSDQKVVSFFLRFSSISVHTESVSDMKEFYKKSLQENVRAMRVHYPGYTMRVYTNSPKEDGFCDVYCRNPDLFWCDVQKVPSYGDQHNMHFTAWRYLPLADDTVDHFLSRNLGSILTAREAAAVRDWLELPNKKAIQAMRDKLDSHNSAMLGGMWGAINAYFGKSEGSTAKELLDGIRYYSSGSEDDTGQRLLLEAVFLPRKDQIVAYDSYHCKYWAFKTMVRPFPVQRENTETDFVGNVGLGNVKYQLKPCPVECRPEYGKDWKYC